MSKIKWHKQPAVFPPEYGYPFGGLVISYTGDRDIYFDRKGKMHILKVSIRTFEKHLTEKGDNNV